MPDLAVTPRSWLEPSTRTIVRDVEAEAVYRVVRNPEGLYGEQDGSYGYQPLRRLPTTASASPPKSGRRSASDRARCSRSLRASETSHGPPEPTDGVRHGLPRDVVTDGDGNTFTRPGTVGVVVRASAQPINSTDKRRRQRVQHSYQVSAAPVRRWPTGGGILGAQSQLEWRDKRYAIEADSAAHR